MRGPAVTTFSETSALYQILIGENDEARRIVSEMLPGERAEFANQLDFLRGMLTDRFGNDVGTSTNNDKATSFWAQVKDAREGSSWRTVKTADLVHEASWGPLTDEMQRRGLRYGELADHLADMVNGAELTAEDGTAFRILKPGQENTQ